MFKGNLSFLPKAILVTQQVTKVFHAFEKCEKYFLLKLKYYLLFAALLF